MGLVKRRKIKETKLEMIKRIRNVLVGDRWKLDGDGREYCVDF